MQFLPKLENQTENEFISELMADCLDLHVFAKAATIQTLDEKNQTGIMSFYLEYGDEPQYKLLRLLGFYSEINPEAQKDMLPKINELAAKARSYINKLKKQSPETRRIRGSAEYLYLEGASPEEIVTEMIDAGVLAEFDSNKKALFDNHLNKINLYLNNFPSHSKIEEIKQEEDWDTLDLGAIEELERKNNELRSILVKRENLH
tara:strand:+ start:2866 stop:3477 length:612 start_codon:yes stop_codon:yes gene_type:complete